MPITIFSAILLFFMVFAVPAKALAYIGPGAGFAFISSFFVICCNRY